MSLRRDWKFPGKDLKTFVGIIENLQKSKINHRHLIIIEGSLVLTTRDSYHKSSMILINDARDIFYASSQKSVLKNLSVAYTPRGVCY